MVETLYISLADSMYILNMYKIPTRYYFEPRTFFSHELPLSISFTSSSKLLSFEIQFHST